MLFPNNIPSGSIVYLVVGFCVKSIKEGEFPFILSIIKKPINNIIINNYIVYFFE